MSKHDESHDAADEPLSPEWMHEIERRSTEIDQGKAAVELWIEIREQIFQQVGLKLPEQT